MTKADLKPGYVVRNRYGDLYMVLPVKNGQLAIVRSVSWDFVSIYRDDLTSGAGYTSLDIMEVYGFANTSVMALNLDPELSDRPLLWKRSEPKKMTMEEVCKALGYDVEIVKEAPNA